MNFITPDWPAPSNVKAFTTTRTGWGEPGMRVWKEESIVALTNLLQLPEQPIWLKQNHGIRVVDAVAEQRGTEADASISDTAQRVCMVETADCLPVLICNRQGTHLSAIHAGWRGLANGIIEVAVQKLAQPAEDLLVWLGPAIGSSKFEVGHDVYEAFVGKHAEAARAFTAKNEEKWLANLYELARLRLQLLGVNAIYGGEYCTYSQDDLFYSYRRDNGTTGRMASVIWRRE